MFLLSRYAEEIFWFSLFPILQYGKPHTPQKITFKYLKNVLQNGVKQIERFGTGHDVFYMPEGEHHFAVSADIEISDQFYSWVCGFRKAAVILSPPDVVEGMEKFLKDIASCYKVAET